MTSTKLYQTRKEAIEHNHNFYYTAKICINGHISKRYTCNRQCVDCIIKYKSNNKIQKKEYDQKYKQDNKEKVKLNNKIYTRNKRKNDIFYRVNNNISRSIRTSLNGSKLGKHWEEFVKFSKIELINHLESLWESWMNWNNYGKYIKNKRTWQIDHIKPLSLCTDFNEAWRLDNLQPLETIKNILKGNKYNGR